MGDPTDLKDVLSYMGMLYSCKPVVHATLSRGGRAEDQRLDRAWIQQEQAVLGVDIELMPKLSSVGRCALFMLGEVCGILALKSVPAPYTFKFEREQDAVMAVQILTKKNTPEKMKHIISINQFKKVTHRPDLPMALYATLAASMRKRIEDCPAILLRDCGSVPYCEMDGFRNPSSFFPYHWYHDLVARHCQLVVNDKNLLIYSCPDAIASHPDPKTGLVTFFREWANDALCAAYGHRCDRPIPGVVCAIVGGGKLPNVGCGKHFMAEYDHQTELLVIINRSDKVHQLCKPLPKS